MLVMCVNRLGSKDLFEEDERYLRAEAARTNPTPDYDRPTKEQSFRFINDMRADNPELFL